MTLLIALLLVLAPPAMERPDWLEKPSGDAVNSVYPPAALAKGLAGKALIRCVVTPTGALSACRVVEESPVDEGFGEAAMKLVPLFKMKPQRLLGSAGFGKVTIPLNFEAAEAYPAPGQGATLLRVLEWSATATEAQIQAAYPADARAGGVQGAAVLACKVAEDGLLESCQITGETPEKLGFGDAALALAPNYRAKLRLSDGSPTPGGVATLPILFTVRAGGEPGPKQSSPPRRPPAGG